MIVILLFIFYCKIIKLLKFKIFTKRICIQNSQLILYGIIKKFKIYKKILLIVNQIKNIKYKYNWI